MAELTKVKRPNRVELLRKVQEQPMPPARLPLEANPLEPALSAGETAQDAAQGAVGEQKSVPAVDEQGGPTGAATPGIGEMTMSRYRFSLHFVDPVLRSAADRVAARYAIPLSHVIRAIAAETVVAADDFRTAETAPPGNQRLGGAERIDLALDAGAAAAWLARHDPLQVYPPSTVLRPVAIAAFERAARKKLPELLKDA
jgi:hypothetical protein